MTMIMTLASKPDNTGYVKLELQNKTGKNIEIDSITHSYNPNYRVSVPSRISLSNGESVSLSAYIPGLASLNETDLNSAWSIISKDFQLGRYM